ncbi:MAG: helix-turn-helix domain-containing protein [Eubacterium sp.]|nr:helix-turn-helix domain-containing protein [Eubacterium sp.]
MPLDFKMIGSNIQNRRKELHITQQKMASDLFISESLVSQLERGVKAVSLETFHSIANYLKTGMDILTANPNDQKAQQNKLINDICLLLDNMDNPHLYILFKLLKTYMEQTQQVYQFPKGAMKIAENREDNEKLP